MDEQRPFDGANAPRSATALHEYRVLRLIGRGGMAEVYLARLTGIEGFEKLVVLKRVVPSLADDRQAVRMFLDEARLASTLTHPNIVHVEDMGTIGESFFYSMEYLEGADLRRLLKAAAAASVGIPLEHALLIAAGVCSGLHYAHEKRGRDGRPLNIVHRDVSPQNLFITYDGTVKLLDFGIAKASIRHDRTGTGMLKGKLGYMSPEQCSSLPIDRRSDLFSLSILLWELTVGRRLFERENQLATIKAVADGEVPPPSALVPGYPPALEAIVMKGLSRDPTGRFQTAEEYQLALEGFARDERLPVSTIGLARLLRELVGDPPPPSQLDIADTSPEALPDFGDDLAVATDRQPVTEHHRLPDARAATDRQEALDDADVLDVHGGAGDDLGGGPTVPWRGMPSDTASGELPRPSLPTLPMLPALVEASPPTGLAVMVSEAADGDGATLQMAPEQAGAMLATTSYHALTPPAEAASPAWWNRPRVRLGASLGGLVLGLMLVVWLGGHLLSPSPATTTSGRARPSPPAGLQPAASSSAEAPAAAPAEAPTAARPNVVPPRTAVAATPDAPAGVANEPREPAPVIPLPSIRLTAPLHDAPPARPPARPRPHHAAVAHPKPRASGDAHAN